MQELSPKHQLSVEFRLGTLIIGTTGWTWNKSIHEEMRGLQMTLSTDLLINDGFLRYGTQKQEAACCSSPHCWKQSIFTQTIFGTSEGKKNEVLFWEMKCFVSRSAADTTLFLAVRKKRVKYWQYFLCSAWEVHTLLSVPLSFNTVAFAFLNDVCFHF